MIFIYFFCFFEKFAFTNFEKIGLRNLKILFGIQSHGSHSSLISKSKSNIDEKMQIVDKFLKTGSKK